MARDAHHAGLPIDFDTERLISKLEAVRVEDSVLSHRLAELKERVAKADGGRYQEIGISAGGTGAFEQMLRISRAANVPTQFSHDTCLSSCTLGPFDDIRLDCVAEWAMPNIMYKSNQQMDCCGKIGVVA